MSRMMSQLCRISLCPEVESVREMFLIPSPLLSVRGMESEPFPLPCMVAVRSPDMV